MRSKAFAATPLRARPTHCPLPPTEPIEEGLSRPERLSGIPGAAPAAGATPLRAPRARCSRGDLPGAGRGQESGEDLHGTGDAHFEDAAFVQAAKEMHEAKLLAEGGFEGSQLSFLEQRYDRAEKELFARREGVGREIENRVTARTAPS